MYLQNDIILLFQCVIDINKYHKKYQKIKFPKNLFWHNITYKKISKK